MAPNRDAFTWSDFETWLLENEEYAARLGRPDNDAGGILQLRRKTTGERAQVMLGVTGEVMQGGDGTWQHPAVVRVKLAACRKALNKVRATMGLAPDERVPERPQAVLMASVSGRDSLICLPCAVELDAMMLQRGGVSIRGYCPVVSAYHLVRDDRKHRADCARCHQSLFRADAQALAGTGPFADWPVAGQDPEA